MTDEAPEYGGSLNDFLILLFWLSPFAVGGWLGASLYEMLRLGMQ